MNNAHNPPTHILFHVKQTSRVDEDTGYRKGLWTRIGAGWRLLSGRINLVQDECNPPPAPC